MTIGGFYKLRFYLQKKFNCAILLRGCENSKSGTRRGFSLNDYNGIALWTNTDGEKHLDIQVATTQQLSVKIKIPSNESSLIHEGCVSIVLGSKE